MRQYDFYTMDVFTDKPFSGNPLAVFTAADGIGDDEMQLIARELNLSETVFVCDSEQAFKKLRIFTPSQELPLAGHPVVGTWNLLARLGIAPSKNTGFVDVLQELKLGVLPVKLEYSEGEIVNVEMTQGSFEVHNEVTDNDVRMKLADALGIDPDDFGNERTKLCQVVSTGIKSVAVPVSSFKALEKCAIKPDKLSRIYTGYGAVGCYVFCFETVEAESLIHARFFAPADGIPEDPATGSAAGALSGFLVHNGIVSEKEFVIEQGDIMDRPGRIRARVDGSTGNVEAVHIGGKAVPIMKGSITLD